MSANNEAAKVKWQLIEHEVKKLLPKNTLYIPYYPPCQLQGIIQALISNACVTNFISAGGDGSINNLINILVKTRKLDLNKFCIGAIGLGSSNDFHKPIRTRIGNIPVKIDFKNKKLADIGVVRFKNNGPYAERMFLINASLGFTAEGNLLFNKGDKVIRFLKAKSTNLAILWTVFKTLTKFKNHYLDINSNGISEKIKVTNVSLAKNPNISGNLRYDKSTEQNSGKLGFYLAEDFSKTEIVKLLYCLIRNRFSELDKCRVKFLQSIDILSDSSIALETDGETFEGKKFHFSILPKSILIAE